MDENWLCIVGGTVIDGLENPACTETDVIVHGDRIVAVGDDPAPVDAPPYEEMRRIDATGRTVMPGLIDVHCHMAYGESRCEEEIDLYTSHEMRTLLAGANLQKVLRAGVTSISMPGGSYFIGVGLREGMARGLLRGPRMTTAGRYLTTSNGLTDWFPDSVGVPEGSIGTLTNTLDAMRNEIRHQVKNGVDLIKLSDSPFGEYQAFTGDELKAVTELAHQLRRPVTIHARGSAEVEAAIAAGVDWIMHGNVMTDEVIERLAESRIPLVPTLLLLANLADWPEIAGVPRGEAEGCRRMLEDSAVTLHKAHDAGVSFAMGTDTGFAVTPYGKWHARELELLMIYAGLSPLEAITAGTSAGARMVGLDGEVGAVRAGYLADLLIIDGDPLANIRVLLDPDRLQVIQGGVFQTFEPWVDTADYSHDRALIYSHHDLRPDKVLEMDKPDGPEYSATPWTATGATDVVSNRRNIEKPAGTPTGPTPNIPPD